MLETISSINSTVNGIVWGVPAMVLIFGVGLYLSIRTGFLQFRKFGTVWQNTIGKLFHRSTEAGRGAVTPFRRSAPPWQLPSAPAISPVWQALSPSAAPALFSGCGSPPCWVW